MWLTWPGSPGIEPHARFLVPASGSRTLRFWTDEIEELSQQRSEGTPPRCISWARTASHAREVPELRFASRQRAGPELRFAGEASELPAFVAAIRQADLPAELRLDALSGTAAAASIRVPRLGTAELAVGHVVAGVAVPTLSRRGGQLWLENATKERFEFVLVCVQGAGSPRTSGRTDQWGLLEGLAPGERTQVSLSAEKPKLAARSGRDWEGLLETVSDYLFGPGSGRAVYSLTVGLGGGDLGATSDPPLPTSGAELRVVRGQLATQGEGGQR